MNTIDYTNDLPKEVQPLELAHYLRATGWEEIRLFADGAGAIWRIRTAAGRKQEVLLPLDPTYDDFEDRMRETLNTLARVEGRPIADIVADLATTSAVEDYEFYGVVTRLERHEPGDGRVTVTTIQEDPPRQVSLALGERDYGVALEAHRDGVPVRCLGTLRKEGRRFVLDNPHRFQISPLE